MFQFKWNPLDCTAKEFFVIKESHTLKQATQRLKQILDAEYKNMYLKSIIVNLTYLKDKYKNSILQLLQKNEEMFDGTLVDYTGSNYTGFNYTIELKEDAKP